MSMETVPVKCARLPIDDLMSILFGYANKDALVPVMKIEWKLPERRKRFRVGVIEQAALLLTLQKLRFFVLGPIRICRASDVDAQNPRRADNSKGFLLAIRSASSDPKSSKTNSLLNGSRRAFQSRCEHSSPVQRPRSVSRALSSASQGNAIWATGSLPVALAVDAKCSGYVRAQRKPRRRPI
jgi:hypothetical protein